VADFIFTKALELYLRTAYQTERKSYETKSHCLNQDSVYINLAGIQLSVLDKIVAQVQALPPKKHIEDAAQASLWGHRIEHSMAWRELLKLWKRDSAAAPPSHTEGRALRQYTPFPSALPASQFKLGTMPA